MKKTDEPAPDGLFSPAHDNAPRPTQDEHIAEGHGDD